MGKMMNALLLAFAINVAMILVGSADETPLIGWLFNAYNWNNTSFMMWVTAAIGVTGLMVAGLYYYKPEFGVFLTIALTLITFGSSILTLWSYLAGQSILGDPTSASLISTLIVAPLAVFYIMTTLDYSRGRD